MPFYLKNKPLEKHEKYKNLEVRDLKTIEELIKKIMIGETEPKLKSFSEEAYFFYIVNNFPDNEINDENCLLEICIENGLNEREVESWLDKKSEDEKEELKEEFTFAPSLQSYDSNKLIYRGWYHKGTGYGFGEGVISYLIWRQDVNKES